MIIKSIELVNFRIYQGYNPIDFSPVEGEGKNIYVVSGKNGFGKTTFLMSLVWCLYGNQMDKVDDLYKQEIDDKGGYTKYIVNSLNRQAKTNEEYSFSVKIVITDAIIPALSCSEISIKRTYNVLTAREDLEILIDGAENELIRELSEGSTKGEDNFIRDYILPIEIAKFFFFDAEKIVSLAEFTTPQQRENLSHAYSEILGIKKYEDTKKVYDEIQMRLRANTASPRERSKITSLNDEISDAKLSISDHNGEILKLKTKRQDLKFESDEIQQKLIRVGNLISLEELEKLRRDRTALENKQNELQGELGKSYDLVPFAIAADRLSEVGVWSRRMGE